MKIVFFGTPPFAANILQYLIESGVEVAAVVTRPDKPRGRSQKMLPSAVKAYIEETYPNLPLHQPEKASTEAFAETLSGYGADFFVVVAYGEILRQNILDLPRLACLNVHASILPKYRGAAPIQRVLMNGEQEAGVSIMEMVLKMDAGAVYAVAKTPVPLEMTCGELEEKLCTISCPALLDTLKKIEEGSGVKKPQDESQVTFAPKISLEDRIIDWKHDAAQIHNQIRGLSPSPGAFCFVEIGGEKKRLQIKKSLPIDGQGEIGKTLEYGGSRWVIGCGNGALSLLEVQLEGKKKIGVSDFLRGYPLNPKIIIA